MAPTQTEGVSDAHRRASHKSTQSAAHSLGSELSAGGQSRLSVQTSMTSQYTDISNTSFTELVAINEEGHPYIDINRLVFRPVHHHHHHADDYHKKEKLSWYVPDFAFIVFNLLSLCISTFFCLIGISTLAWKSSIGMFSVPPCWSLINATDIKPGEAPSPERENNFYYLPCRHFTKNDDKSEFTDKAGYNWHPPNSFPILRTKLTDVHYFGLVLIFIELCNVINVIMGINACLKGYKRILIQHIALDTLILLGEFIISSVVAFTSVCDYRDLAAIRIVLKNFVRWYGVILKPAEHESDKEKLIELELDALQISLGCCGVDGWGDYMANRFPSSQWHQSRNQLDDAEVVIPYSCCRSWWIRNIYCSHGVHRWAHPMATEEMADRFQERIVQDGCMYKLEKLCLNLRSWMGHHGFVVTLIHLVFVVMEAISALILIKNINALIREKKKLMRRKEMLHEDGDAGSDLDFSAGRNSLSSKDGKGKSPWSRIPPPTEDEIITIKQRSNFNNFMNRVKGGQVGKWMKAAQDKVTEGHEEVDDEMLTEEEKKRREKEMLHGKTKPVDRSLRETPEDKRQKGKSQKRDQKKLLRKKTDKPDGTDFESSYEPSDMMEATNAAESDNQMDAAKKAPSKKGKKSVTIAPHKKKKRKTRVLFQKEPETFEIPPAAAEPEAEGQQEPPPLTSETEAYTTSDEDGKHKKHKKKKRKKRKKKNSEKPPWYKQW